MKEEVVVLLSGGMDSTVLAHMTEASGYQVVAVAVDYGQRHSVELEYAEESCRRHGWEFNLIEFPDLGAFIPGSALTDSTVDVPEGHYAAESMKSTVVPMRNPMMLSIALAIGSARKVTAVATAVHSGDHHIYPDCRPGFVGAFQMMTSKALDGFHRPALLTPFLHMSKADICAMGESMGIGVNWRNTWSCYLGGAIHCGLCGTCVERREAFTLAGVDDPTEYAT